MPCYSPLKGWKDAETGGIIFKAPSGPTEHMEVACGQCLGCRLDYSRMWAMRIIHESVMWESDGGNCFVTLTYRDKSECTAEQLYDGYHVPDDWSLNKKHFQDFMKRLRKAFPGVTIRYFHCGEYGAKCKHGIELDSVKCPMCNVGRPHYHACLFNLRFTDLLSYKSDNGVMRYTSPLLQSIWKFGFVDVGDLNFESAAYVARYALKKVTGVKADDHYLSCDVDGVVTFLEPEYCTMSRRPGIGKTWFEMFSSDVFPHDHVPVPGKGVVYGVPRYYDELFANENPLSLEEIKRCRDAFMKEHADEFTPARLMSKYKVKKAQVEMLRRTVK